MSSQVIESDPTKNKACDDPGSRTDGYSVLRHKEDQWMVQMGSLGTLDPYQGCNKKDDARADAWKT